MLQSTIDQIRPIIISHLTPLINLLGISDHDIDKSLLRYDHRNKQIIENAIDINLPHCLYDYALAASKGDQHSLSFIKYIYDQVSEILNSLDHKFHKTIRNTAQLIILTLDDNPSLKNNPSFMNYVGEIVGLNFILQKEKERFDLLSIEKKLPNSKSADFEFLDKSNGDKVLIEFVRLHGIDASKIEETEIFKDFLESRFNQKLDIKTENLISHYNRIEMVDGSKPNFTILPIIWSEVVHLLPFRNAFDELNFKYANVLPCVSLMPQLLEDNSVNFSLTTVSNILDRWENVNVQGENKNNHPNSDEF